jgi:predicted transcriptional regulator
MASTARVSIIGMLQVRPRCLSEMADQLKVTQQAVLKHLKMLEDLQIVRSSDLPEDSPTMVRRIYKLAANAEFDIQLGEHLSTIHGFISMNTKHAISKGPASGVLVDLLNDIEDEKARVRRRLRTVMEREHRFIEDLFALENTTEEILEAANLHDLDRILVRAYLQSGLQGSDQVSKSLRFDSATAEGRLAAALALRLNAD